MSTLTQASSHSSTDARVEDYLDDKFQSLADLDNLDELLANVELQRNQLQSQLDDATKELQEARRTAGDRQGSLATRIKDFRELQDSIDKRVTIAAASDAPNRAIARLQAPMKKIKTVDLTKQYLTLLQDVASLRTAARFHLPHDPKAALDPYTQLKEMAMTLRDLPGSDSLHLVTYVEGVTDALWNEMKKTMSEELETLLKKRNWPRIDPQTEMDEEWLACVEKLLDLQYPEILHSSRPLPLLPFDVMSKIFVAEFRFHFLSDKPTSSGQALATHCYPWFLATIEKWEDFFRDNLGHLLASKFQGTPAGTKSIYVDPLAALVTSMLPVMREKVSNIAGSTLGYPLQLSDFVSKLLVFDDNVRSRFGYDGGDAENGWEGLSAEFLNGHFQVWFDVERRHALDRFENIMETQDARKIDYNYAGHGRMKPTFAATRVTDLLRTVTTQYERLRKYRHKIRFLMNIQLDILDSYHDRLRGSLEAYQSMTSTLGRKLQGASKEQIAALQGTGALEALCKVIGSADHMATTLTDWSDEEFFSILWEELQSRSAKRASHDTAPGGVSYEEVRDRVSSQPDGDEEGGALFDETISAYSARQAAGEELLVSALAESHSKAFRAYMNHVQWTTVGDPTTLDGSSELSITPELDEPIHVLRRNLEFLSKTLSTASFKRVWHEALEKLQDILWTGVLLRQSFTTLGATQFQYDGNTLFALIDRYIPGGSSALNALRDGMRLLALPTETEIEGDDAAAVNGAEEGQMTLKRASNLAFRDNDGCRLVLREMDLEALTTTNVRYVLQRRVENNENVGW